MARVSPIVALPLLAACAFWKPATPRMETEDGRACIATCDVEYYNCTSGCCADVGGGSGSGWPRLVGQMFGAMLEHVDDPTSCPQRLETCYASCIDV
jgi:hypothetical protein